MPHDSGRSYPEKRDTSPTGIARRARFKASLNLLCSLGLSPHALEHYRQLARETRVLPHALVCYAAEKTAFPPPSSESSCASRET